MQTNVLNITLGMQFVNLSPIIYWNANTYNLCQYQGGTPLSTLTIHVSLPHIMYLFSFIIMWVTLGFST